MADIIAFKDIRRMAGRRGVSSCSGQRPALDRDVVIPSAFPTARPGVSGNLSDLFEQANAVAMRYYDGDPKVSEAVAGKCIELLRVLTEYAEPE